jgi:hypothetical protein
LLFAVFSLVALDSRFDIGLIGAGLQIPWTAICTITREAELQRQLSSVWQVTLNKQILKRYILSRNRLRLI